jgi:hypothetical protein
MNFFCTWVAWEKGPNQKAKEAAQVWKTACAMSKENNYMPSVNVVVNNEIGGCCDNTDLNQITVILNNETNIDDAEPSNEVIYNENSGEPQPPDEWEGPFADWSEFNDAKCRAANFYADRMLSSLTRIRWLLDNVIDTGIGKLITAILLASADGPSPGLDAAALAILITPSLKKWLIDEAGQASDIAALILTMDKCEIVDLIYASTTRQNLGQALGDYFEAKVAASSLPANGKEWLTLYVNYVFRTRWSNFLFDTLDTLVPDGYAITCPCGGPASSTDWGFETGLDGFISGPNVDVNEFFEHDAVEGDDNAGSIHGGWLNTVGTGGYYDIDKSGISYITSNDTQFLVNLKGEYTGAMTLQIVVSFSDASAWTSPTTNFPTVNTYGSIQYNLAAVHAGKTVTDIQLIVRRTGIAGDPDDFYIDRVQIREAP